MWVRQCDHNQPLGRYPGIRCMDISTYMAKNNLKSRIIFCLLYAISSGTGFICYQIQVGSSVAQSHQLVHAVFSLVYAIVEVNKIIPPLLLYLGQNSLIDDDDDDDPIIIIRVIL